MLNRYYVKESQNVLLVTIKKNVRKEINDVMEKNKK